MKLIDADKLKRKCQKTATEAWKMKINASAETIMNQFIDFIDEADTVDAVPVRRGRWKEDPSGYGFWICSACGFVSEASAANVLYKFCPHCGARNIEGDDES